MTTNGNAGRGAIDNLLSTQSGLRGVFGRHARTSALVVRVIPTDEKRLIALARPGILCPTGGKP